MSNLLDSVYPIIGILGDHTSSAHMSFLKVSMTSKTPYCILKSSLTIDTVY